MASFDKHARRRSHCPGKKTHEEICSLHTNCVCVCVCALIFKDYRTENNRSFPSSSSFFTGIIKVSTATKQNHYDIPKIPLVNDENIQSSTSAVNEEEIVEVRLLPLGREKFCY